ncbi:MAG: hypothetical protein ABSH20_31295 [Tepidisphaeraceae bacterium]
MSKKKSKKARMIPSAQPGVNGVRSGAVPSINDGNLPATGAGADLAKFWTAQAFDNPVTQDDATEQFGVLPTDANLQRMIDRSERAYSQPDKGQSFGLPPSGPGGLPTDANLARINARAVATSTPAAQVAALTKAISALDQSIGRIRDGRDARQYANLDRLAKARQAIVTKRDAILARTGHDSAGNDPDFRARASAESTAPGIGNAIDQISALQDAAAKTRSVAALRADRSGNIPR